MRLTIASSTTPTCVPRSSSALCRQLDTLLELYIDRGRARSQDGAKTDTVLFSTAVSRYGAVAVAAVVVGARGRMGSPVSALICDCFSDFFLGGGTSIRHSVFAWPTTSTFISHRIHHLRIALLFCLSYSDVS